MKKTLTSLILSLILTLIISINVSAEVLDYDSLIDDFYEDEHQENMENVEPDILRGIITYVGPMNEPPEDQQFYLGIQEYRLKVTSRGDFYGQEFDLENLQTGHPLYDLELEKGQRVLVYVEIEEGQIVNIGIQSYIRDYYIYILVGVFVMTLILIGGLKGIKALTTLIIMGLLIVFGLLPLLLRGYNPLMLSIVFSSLIAVLTLFIVGGFNKKSFAAIGGVIGGLIIAGLLAVIFGNIAHLTGFSSEEAQMLQFVDETVKIDMNGLLIAGIIIGTLGAVLDVGMSTASSMSELKASVPNISSKELFKAGMNVGRDIMGTMVNTLILAYTGGALPLLLIFRAYETPYANIINMDLIATEVVRSLVGSLGLILAIPLTAFIFILLCKKKASHQF